MQVNLILVSQPCHGPMDSMWEGGHFIYVHSAAGSRLPRSSHEFFSPFCNFSNTPYVANVFVSNVFEQAVGPGVLQTFSTCVVKL